MKKKVSVIIIFALLLPAIAFSGLSSNRNTAEDPIPEGQYNGKPALIRFEDVGPGEQYKNQENLDKLIVIADYLQQEGIPFEVSLIPRIVVPDSDYDVTIADNTAYSQNFVATMKGLEERGGIIGVHGYTHQSGNSQSISGYEFYSSAKNPNVPNTTAYAKERILSAIDLFNKAGIKPAYWETPHYSASPQQLIALQEQIGLIYENNYYYPAAWQSNKVLNENERNYCGLDVVPTPLGHLNSPERLASMLAILNDKEKAETLASLYMHPTYEFQFIKKIQLESGKIQYIYDKNSLLHQLVKELKSRGYTFVSIYSLVGYVPAQREENIPFHPGDDVFAGQFVSGASGKSLLIWNKGVKQWHMYRYTASWYAPRGIAAFQDLGIWLKDLALDSSTVPLTGHFKNKDREDLLLFNAVSGNTILAENTGDKFIPNHVKWEPFNELQTIQPLSGDLNGDGLTDLFFYDKDNGRIGTAINQAGLFPDRSWQYFDLLKTKNLQLLAGDFNGDDISDVLVIDYDKNQSKIMTAHQTNSSSLSLEPWNSQFSLSKDSQIFAADINGDSKDDLLVYRPDGLWLNYISDGNGFVSSRSFGPWGSGKQEAVYAADINGDNSADLIRIDHYTGQYNLNTAISVIGKN